MPAAVVELPSLIGDVLDGLREVQVDATTLGGALQGLIKMHPRLEVHLFTESGKLRRHIRCFLNDKEVRDLGGLDVAVSDGDRIAIIQAISGG